MADDDVVRGAHYHVASLGELLSEPSRVAMLLALMDGSARPASELAERAGVTRATASEHLARLRTAQLVAVEQAGRHRYYRLANEQVADALEAIALLRPARDVRKPPSKVGGPLADARTCYRHLAGRLGVALLGALERERMIALSEGALALTKRGQHQLSVLIALPDSVPRGKPCLDWTERRHHLGGPLGTLLTDRMFELGWLARRAGSRAVRVTTRGERALSQHFGLTLTALDRARGRT